MSGTIDWFPTRDQPVREGRLITVSGLMTLDVSEGYPGHDVGFALLEHLHDVAGVERSAWGKVEYLFGRMRCPPHDVLQMSASVFVNAGEKRKADHEGQ